MTECDVYKIIDEFISKSQTEFNTTNRNDSCHIQTPSQTSAFGYSQLHSPAQDTFLTNDSGISTTPSPLLFYEQNNLRPNRPYSYYVATNFHPFDLQAELQNQQSHQKPELLTPEQSNAVKILRINVASNEKLNFPKKKPQKNNLNRLSVSLTDVVKQPLSINGSLQTQDNLINGTNINKLTSQSCVLNEGSVANKTASLASSTPNKKNRSPILKLFRRLFQSRKSPSYEHANNLTVEDRNEHQIETITPIPEEEESSKFLRFFSFRSAKSQNKLHISTPVACKKDSNQSKHENKLMSPVHLHQNALTTESYSEIVDKLKKIASEPQYADINNNTNPIIPFIDDDIASLSHVNFDTNIDALNCKFLSNTNKNPFFSKNDISDDLIKDLVQNATYNKFESIILNATLNCDTKWQKIAIIFEISHRAIQCAGLNTDLAFKLKEITANYIHDRYCDTIQQNGGWRTIPDSLSPSNKSTDLCNLD